MSTKTKQMYSVTTGNYSSYRVLCVCDSKARADQIVAAATRTSGYADYRVESMLVMDHDPILVTIHGLTCDVMDDGTTNEQYTDVRTEWDFDVMYPEYHVASFVRWVRAPVYNGKGGRLEVHGTDLEAVRHVFSDTRAQLLTDDVLRRRGRFARKGRA